MNLTLFINQRIIRVCKIAILIIFFYLLCSSFTTKPVPIRRQPKQIANYTCPNDDKNNISQEELHVFLQSNGTDRKALLLLESLFSRNRRTLTSVLNYLKIPYKIDVASKNFPLLTTSKKGKYALIIIENYYKYLNMPKWNRQLLDKYCHDYNVPIISFVPSKRNDSLKRIKIKGTNLWMWQNQEVISLTAASSFLHKIVKAGTTRTDIPGSDWVLFEPSKNYQPLLHCGTNNSNNKAVAVYDEGKEDGVKRILFGRFLTDWSIKLTFIDSLLWIFGKDLNFSLDRFIEVDIDDIFVGAQGTRMIRSDVLNLIKYQEYYRTNFVENFSFMLGFSGSYYHYGNILEDEGDDALIENSHEFIWFPHMWRHNHAHEHNFTYLSSIMAQNKLFALNNKLNVNYSYAIAPQHDGVFPINEGMYVAWKDVWNISVTATEEYPHFKPSSCRKAFIYKNVSVLPRQTCGLYTHTQMFDNYPDGIEKLIESIEGGELFFTIVLNRISIFMTHQQNYAHDRLALYTFDNLFRFIRCWTNLRLKWQNPIESAKLYFKLYPDEKNPIWTNPCDDSRHAAILPSNLNCSSIVLPNVLILGPQKTGSTALASFLSSHPNTRQNVYLERSFEEVQFFGGRNYAKGIEWYMSKFEKAPIVFEKSATYFDNPHAAKQASSLVPNAKLVIILHDPVKRAYSWFQHLLAHDDSIAKLASNMSVILDADSRNVEPTLLSGFKKIRSRCISGGRYLHHLNRWIDYFSLNQIYFVDGDELKKNPIDVMKKLCNWLGCGEFNFNETIQYSPSKGFYCKVINGKKKCLGKSKGRKYEEMSDDVREKLNRIFELENAALYKFLKKNRLMIPKWLYNSLRERNIR